MKKFVIYKIYWRWKCFYIGKTKGFGKRRNRHLREMKDGTHHNKKLIEAYAKFGKPIIKIIAVLPCEHSLNQLEKELLIINKNNKKCCNIQH